MNITALLPAAFLALTFGCAADAAQLMHFSPLGNAAEVSQVTANFDLPVRPLGNLDGPAPLTWSCGVGTSGKARWVDVRTWAVDFAPRLPAGVSCEFKAVSGLKDVAGQALKMNPSYRFNTGGPMAADVSTGQGRRRGIDEEAVFIVRATGDLDFSSIEKNAWCEADGISERIPVKLLSPADRKALLNTRGEPDVVPSSTATLRCARRLPNGAKVSLHWGEGIKGTSGLATLTTTRHEFHVREDFGVKVSCARENAKAGCNPFGNIPLHFSAPVLREDAAKLRLVGPKGKQWEPALLAWGDEEGGGDPESEIVNQVQFNGPFPAEATFRLVVPARIRDDAGRPLANRDRLAKVELQTAEYPPLLKFAADFGIVESKAGGLLPVTLRNLDPLPAEAGVKTADGSVAGTSAKVRVVRVVSDEDLFAWKQRIGQVSRFDDRRMNLLKDEPSATVMLLPKPHGAKSMEVVGIPLGEPGFYVVEAESHLLGKSLLDVDTSMFVRTQAINTNLAVHFKKGAENQLVWVTTLDTAMPVADARVSIRDCNGNQLAFGKTGPDGTMAVKRRLAPNPRQCTSGVYGYYVSARATFDGVTDFSFTLSEWQSGIEPWRYQLPYGSGALPDILTHTIFDRPLFRAGETVNMKHVARRHTTAGYGWVPREQLPDKAVIQLEGSELRYDLPLVWKGGSAESSWTIPAGAKLGKYWISFARANDSVERVHGGESDEAGDGEGWWPPSRFWRGGSFRVGEFRLPVLRGEVALTKPDLQGENTAEVDLKLAYLAGGGAGGEKVRLRSEMTPWYFGVVQPPEPFAQYQFASPPVDPEQMKNGGWQRPAQEAVIFDDQRDVQLDAAGTRRATLRNIPAWNVPALLRTEMEYSDPSGEIHTASATARWFPSAVLAGIRAEGVESGKKNETSQGSVKLLTLDAQYQPRPGTPYTVQAWQIKTLVHRKRLVGGVYSYDTQYESVDLGEVCRGNSDDQGAAECTVRIPARARGVQMQVVLQVKALDASQRVSHASTVMWFGDHDGEGEAWYEQGDSDRIDVVPERKKYEAGETAVFTVKMPFREATALVSVEREGVIDRFVVPLSGKEPVVKLPIKPHYGPNVFVSVLVVRGRVGDVQPTALVDLGKPAYKLGIAEIEVGRKGYELKVEVEPMQTVYRTREEASVRVKVTRPDGSPARGGEFALAAVDEALLELAPNPSWQLLSRLMARRGYAVETATAQTQVIGKRHFGLKAMPAGGGGGRQPTRELFDTLIKWSARVVLDDHGEAIVKLPLNDSLTKIRVVAVAQQGVNLFGTGMASFRTTKDVQIFSGLPPVVRDADRFRAGFTVRNLTAQEGQFTVNATVNSVVAGKTAALPALPPQTLRLAAGEGREVAWQIRVPAEATRIEWRAEARALGGDGSPTTGASDALKVQQKVLPSIPVKVQAATLEQLDRKLSIPVQMPREAVRGRGSIDVFLKDKLGASIDGVLAWMDAYPYLCLEQKLSRALATRRAARWDEVNAQLSFYLDNNGLAHYFTNPGPNAGSPTLTAYILTSGHVAGYPLPPEMRDRMLRGLTLFIEGRIVPNQRYWSPQEDLPVRKLKSLEALARHGLATQALLATIPLTPGVWPTSGVVSWMNVLIHMPTLPNHATLLAEAEKHLSARMVRSGTLTQFSREREDYWWWLMDSPDGTAARAITTLMDLPGWQSEIPRLVRGVLSRQREGHWDTTLANVWGVLMLEKFARKYESDPVSGITEVAVEGIAQRFDWSTLEAARQQQEISIGQGLAAVTPVSPAAVAWRDPGSRLSFAWPASGNGTVVASQSGGGKPWLTVQARAARALTAPVYAGFDIRKKITPIDQKHKGRWSRGDVVEVELSVSASSPWTWVVIDDPVPAGATILGSGLGRESALAGGNTGGDSRGYQLAHTERAFDAYRSYYEYFHGSAQSPHKLTYRLRLNNAGEFVLPPTRVEAMYAPENFGEVPNAAWSVAD